MLRKAAVVLSTELSFLNSQLSITVGSKVSVMREERFSPSW